MIRLALAAVIVLAVVATLADTARRAGGINPFNFFGYFTIQSNLLFAAVLVAGGVRFRARRVPSRSDSEWLDYARASSAVYIVIVGVVYNTLLAPLAEAGGVPVPWANTVLHVVAPIIGALDWVAVGDRPALDWRRLWVPLIYPRSGSRSCSFAERRTDGCRIRSWPRRRAMVRSRSTAARSS